MIPSNRNGLKNLKKQDGAPLYDSLTRTTGRKKRKEQSVRENVPKRTSAMKLNNKPS